MKVQIDYPKLAHQIAESDQYALEELYDHLHQEVYYYALTALRDHDAARDIVQNTFLKLWDKRASLKEVRSLKDFVFRMVKNQVLDVFRKSATQEAKEGEVARLRDEQYQPIEDHLLYNEYMALAKEGISQLPPRRKEIFLLSRFEHKSYAEIADQLNISINVVEKQMSKALKQLREYMTKHADIAFPVVFFLVLH
ncbi:RNA polymerase sigma factor [Marinoscillum furvescens]|uniref:RNA polymerase sigma-70 factor (ECF subfamily) n=1 Tax=Marinoscillum furvescens DSM 4134 TaxID=1122208 RepID=A0A3D9KZ08_MARFU|nr:RNA polymerase sigma-70 factor [Marinoscillum furvescens]RED93213.1 RNA polymerase sigma-70 factor (ECF subfamily) [Marinoscillum furvescens DSM 4134]